MEPQVAEKVGGPIGTACGAIGWGIALVVICAVVVWVAPKVRRAIKAVKGTDTDAGQ